MAITSTIPADSRFQYEGGDPHRTMLAKTSDGTMWALIPEKRHLENSQARLGGLWRSNDGGATWTFYQALYDSNTADMDNTYILDYAEFQIHVDHNDVLHMIYAEPRYLTIQYQRATKSGSAGNYGWSWGSKYTVDSVTSLDPKGPGMTVHPHGTGMMVHVFWYGTAVYYGNNKRMYRRLTVSSSGSVSMSSTTSILVDDTTYQRHDTAAQNNSATFYNTGDGLTVKDGTPHILWVWGNSATSGIISNTGGYPFISYVKLTYTGGDSWSMGSVNKISDYGMSYVSENEPSVFCDGTNFVIGGAMAQGYFNQAAGYDTRPVVAAWDINPTTLARTQIFTTTSLAYNLGGGAAMRYTPDRDLIFTGSYSPAGSGTLPGMVARYNRTLGKLYKIWESTTHLRYPVTRPGPVTNTIDLMFSAGTTAPYSKYFISLSGPGNWGTPELVSHEVLTFTPEDAALYSATADNYIYLDPRVTNVAEWQVTSGDTPPQYKISVAPEGYGSVFTHTNQPGTTYTLPSYAEGNSGFFHVAATNGDITGPPLRIRMVFNSWTNPNVLVNTTEAVARLSTTGLTPGESYEVQIKPKDNTGVYSTQWSDGATFALTDGPITNVYYFNGTAWVPATRKILDDITWKDHIVQKL